MSLAGLHIQGHGAIAPDGLRERPVDGTRVLRNVIVGTAVSTSATTGGIRVRDGTDIVVADNNIAGPWANSVAATNIRSSVIRGNSSTGAVAGVVVLDVERVRDKATYPDPHQLSEGMVYVLVNGEFAVDNGGFTDVMSGRVLRLRR